jgi:putative endonuclease
MKMTLRRKLLGRQGEDAATNYLKKNNYQILCRNYTCKLGEIDIVARERDFIVFVEVRSRSSEDFGLPQETINRRKKMKLRNLARYYLKETGKSDENCRFDIIALVLEEGGNVKRLEHIENAF